MLWQQDALKNEEAHRVGAAAVASSSVPQTVAPASGLSCAFCGNAGHSVERCFKFEEYSKKAKDEVKEASSKAKN